jgi:hypothetical protein
MKSLVFLLVFLFCSSAQAVDVEFFESQTLFESPIAYKRSVDTGVTYKSSKYLGRRIYYIEAMLGREMPIVDVDFKKVSFQLGVEAGTWLTLGYKEGAFPLLTQDFAFAFPLFFEAGNFSGGVKWNHISAHLGDGMDVLLEETLTPKEKKDLEFYERIADSVGVDIGLMEPFNYSRDFVSAHLDYKHKMGIFDSRIYWHGGYAYKIFPRELKKYFVGTGIETIYNCSFLSPYYAHDLTYNGDVDLIDFSMQAGVFLLSGNEDPVTMRLAFTGHVGSDRRGQLLGRKLRQVGIGLIIR